MTIATFICAPFCLCICNFNQNSGKKVTFKCKALLWFAPGRQQGTTQSLYRPSPSWDGKKNGKKKAKLLGQNKGSLTEEQMKWTVTMIILIRRIYKTNSEMQGATLPTQCPVCSQALIIFPPASCPAQNQAQWHMALNTLFCLASLGQLAQLCPLLASCEN